jgi:hypothetical protein
LLWHNNLWNISKIFQKYFKNFYKNS